MHSAPITNVGRGAEREWLVLLSVFVGGFLILLSRKPDAIFSPQFYIEDGMYWYAYAHELGVLPALTTRYRGYFVLVQSLGGSLANLFPLAWAPLAMALFGIVLDVLPAVFIASSRFAALVPSLPRRLFLAFLCLAAPNTWYVMSNTTNTMWYLGLLACLVVLANPPTRQAWRIFDLAVVVLSGLSGPFAILLAPIAALNWWFRRERWTLVLLVATTAVALVQAASIALSLSSERMRLGADPLKLWELFVRRVIYEALFGQVGGAKIMAHEWGAFWLQPIVIGLAGLAGLAMLVYAILRAPLELRLFIVYAALTLAATIAWPGPPSGDAQWWDLLIPAGNGNRYFLATALAFLFTCAWLATAKPMPVRFGGVLLLAVAVVFGIRLNWREPPYRNFEFAAAVKRYQAAPVGATVVLLTPPDQLMTLTKKSGEPVEVLPEECAGEVPVTTKLLVSNQMTWKGRAGRTEGTDPYAIFGLPARLRVCGVRVGFILTNPTHAQLMLQMFWAESGEQALSEAYRSSTHLVTTGPALQTAVFHIHDTIDRIRFDPGTVPGTVLDLEEVVLLIRPNEQRR